MTKFEVLEPASSGQELVELAHQAEAYINNHTRLQRRRTREAIDDLNFAASEMCLHEPVQLAGIVLVSLPGQNRTNPAESIKKIGYGNVNGTYLGFRAIDLYEELDAISPSLDSEDLELSDTLLKRAYGRYAVCHCIALESHANESKDGFTDTVVTHRTMGPISSSVLFANGRYNELPRPARHREVAKIIDLMTPEKQKIISDICAVIAETDDAMVSLTSTAEMAKALFTSANSIERSALIEVINTHILLSGSEKRFCFIDGMPTCLFPNGDDDNCDIYKPEDSGPLFMEIEGVSIAPDYEDVKPDVLEINDRVMQLFIKGILIDIAGVESEVLIPAQHVQNYHYRPTKQF